MRRSIQQQYHSWYNTRSASRKRSRVLPLLLHLYQIGIAVSSRRSQLWLATHLVCMCRRDDDLAAPAPHLARNMPGSLVWPHHALQFVAPKLCSPTSNPSEICLGSSARCDSVFILTHQNINPQPTLLAWLLCAAFSAACLLCVVFWSPALASVAAIYILI